MTKNITPDYDDLLIAIADYCLDFQNFSPLAYQTAHFSLMDSLGCALLALKHKECVSLLGPIVPGTKVPLGSRVIGTSFELDPIKGAFDTGAMIRWLDYNDTWLAKEWAHPSDNLGGILAVADYVSRSQQNSSSRTSPSPTSPLLMKSVLEAMIIAYEIQGILALDNAFNQVGLDHVILVKLGTAAALCRLWGLTKQQTLALLSEVWVDGQSLRTYRHAPNTMQRKSWAGGDASSRAVFLSWLVKHGEPGLRTPISAKRWGFSDAFYGGKPVLQNRPFGNYVMENILFKVLFPAEFHSQTALEAAIQLHQKYKKRLDEIQKIEIFTQEAGDRIINKTGPLHNYADRDHCIQYIVAIGLLKGDLTSKDYKDEAAADPRIDELRSKMTVAEEVQFSRDYLDPDKRAIGNSVQLFFENGEESPKVTVHYPIGHKTRRKEALPYLKEKFTKAVQGHFPDKSKSEALIGWWDKQDELMNTPVDQFVQNWVEPDFP